MPSSTATLLLHQLDISWQLLSYHLDGLTTEACLWQPADRGLTVLQDDTGRWTAQWPETEAYEAGPPDIAWLTWHIGFWWSMVLDHSFGAGTLAKEAVSWPGTAEGVRAWLSALHNDWTTRLAGLSEADLQSDRLSRWPLEGRPFAEIAVWVNLELMKNAAEIGYARFLYACRR